MNTESVGAKLKKIRLEKGLTLEEVQKKTKIHLNVLKAIEGDSLTNLSPVYLKGFLKIYCEFLGVKPADYIPDYRHTQHVVSQIETQPAISEKAKNLLSALKSASLRLSSFRPHKKIKKAFLLILIIVFLWFGLFNLGKFISSKRKLHLAQEKTESKKEIVVKPTQKSQIIQTALPKKEIVSGIRLGIRAKENCWISLKVDGRLVFQRVLEKGRFESWQAKERIELAVGNAAVIELDVNGQLFSNLGRRGQVLKNIVITKEGLSVGR